VTGMTYTCSSTSYCLVKAIHFPSGENFPNTSMPGCAVRRVARPPDVEASQRSPPYVAQMRPQGQLPGAGVPAKRARSQLNCSAAEFPIAALALRPG